MQAAEIFSWGVVAGFLAYLAVFVAPNLRSLWRHGVERVHPLRLLLLMLVFAIYLAVSGGLAVLVSEVIDAPAFYIQTPHAAGARAIADATVSWYY